MKQIRKYFASSIEKKLQGKEEYRLRVGSFRIVFTKEDNELYIKKIDNRGQVYK